jgi:hypothetical protein
MNYKTTLIIPALLLASIAAFANVYGAIRGVVHDPQHRPVQGAMVMLKAKASDWAKTVNTDTNGEFQLNAVPLGDYSVSVAIPGFAQTVQDCHGHLGDCAGGSLSIAGGLGQRKSHRLGLGPDRSHRQRDSHHSCGQPKYSAQSWRRPNQQSGHDLFEMAVPPACGVSFERPFGVASRGHNS